MVTHSPSLFRWRRQRRAARILDAGQTTWVAGMVASTVALRIDEEADGMI
jgi:hypothetical protein